MRDTFLFNDEADAFVKQYRAPRHVMEVYTAASGAMATSAPLELTQAVLREVNDFRKRGTPGTLPPNELRCIHIQGKWDDGLTWSAEMVLLGAKSLAPCACVQARAGAGDLPAIADLLGRRKFRRLMNDFTTREGAPDRRLVRSLAVAFITALIAILPNLSDHTELVKSLGSHWTWGIVVTIALLTYVAQTLAQGGAAAAETMSRERLDELVTKDPERYTELVEHTVKAVRTGEFRITIVDDFCRLDAFSRDVVHEYLRTEGERAASEFWIVLDGKRPGYDRFQDLLLLRTNEHLRQLTRTYELLLLTPDEKRTLIERLGLDAEALRHAQLIKHICAPERVNSGWIEQVLREHHASRPPDTEPFDELDILLLMALMNISPRQFETTEYYTDLFAHAKGLEREVLLAIRPKGRFTTLDIKAKLKKLFPATVKEQVAPKGLARLIEARMEKGALRYASIPELQEPMIRMTGDLGLPPEELGHLFWCLHWANQVDQRPETARYLKLCDHLEQCGEMDRFAEDRVAVIRERLFDVSVDAIAGCLRTGLHHELPGLIEQAVALTEDSVKSEVRLRRLSKRIWQAYCVTEEPSLMDHLLRLHALNPTLTASDGGRATTPSELIFWELSARHGDGISAPNILAREPVDDEEMQAVRDRAFVRALSVQLTLMPRRPSSYAQVMDAEYPVFRYFAIEADPFEKLTSVMGRCTARIRENADMCEIDLLTLGDALHCFGVLTHYHHFRPSLGAPLDDREEVMELFLSWADAVVDVLEMAQRRTMGRTRAEQQSAFLRQALLFDVATSATGAMLMVANVTFTRWSADTMHVQELAARIDAQLGRLGTICAFELPRLDPGPLSERSPGLVDRTKALMRLCAVTWTGMELSMRAGAMMFKELQLRVLLDGTEDLAAFKASASELSRREDIHGLLANMLLVKVEVWSVDLRSLYFNTALNNAISNERGPVLTNEMLLLQLFHFYKLAPELFDSGSREGIFIASGIAQRYMALLPDDGLTELVYRTWGARQLIKEEANLEQFERFAEQELERRSPKARQEPEEAWKAARQAERIRMYPNTDTDATVREWADACADMNKAHILGALLRKGHHTPQLVEHSIRTVLENMDELISSTFMRLACSLGALLWRTKHPDGALLLQVGTYIEKYLNQNSNSFPVEDTTEAYQLLGHLVPDRAAEFKDAERAWALKNQEHVESMMKYHMAGRRYFEWYRSCYGHLRSFGLRTELEEAELQAGLHLGGSDLETMVERLVQSGPVIVEPVTKHADGSRVMSSEFLIIGRLLYDSGHFNNTELDAHRGRFEQAARDGIRDLVALVTELPHAPKSMLTHMRSYMVRLDQLED